MEAKKLKDKTSLQLISTGHTPQEYLIGPMTDVLMMGGLSLIFFVAVNLFLEPSASTFKLGWVMFYLSFAVNYPHFMSSYLLMYGDYRKEITTNIKFTWAGIIAPTLIVTALSVATYYALQTNDTTFLGYAPSLMYFLVGHHYVKQIYGCVMVSSAKKKFYFDKVESRCLWVTMYSIWAMSFLSTNANAVAVHSMYGINYTTLGLDGMWLKASFWASGLALSSFVFLMVKRYIKDGKVMPLSAWTAIVTIYAWYIPAFYNAHYFLMIPFFHSLQYLLFTNVFLKNKSSAEAKVHENKAHERAAFLKKFCTFTGLALLTGFLAWDYIPNFLDKNYPMSSLLGPTYFMFAFQIFLNVHHYIIDNVIWRKDNPLMKKYL